MHIPDEIKTLALGEAPYLVLQFPQDADGFDVGVTGEGFASEDEVSLLLLLVVEKITGISSDLYVQQIDIARRSAGLRPLAAS